MGKQTGVVATEVDEQELVAFIRSTAEVKILRRGADNVDSLWSADLPPYSPLTTQYYFWNQHFSWEPRIEQVSGGYIIRDIFTAPLIEFVRTDVQGLFRRPNPYRVSSSRLYWAKRHMSDAPGYSIEEFEKWYDRVVRWVRRVGIKEASIAGSPFLLPDAHRRWRELWPVE